MKSYYTAEQIKAAEAPLLRLLGRRVGGEAEGLAILGEAALEGGAPGLYCVFDGGMLAGRFHDATTGEPC